LGVSVDDGVGVILDDDVDDDWHKNRTKTEQIRMKNL